MFQVQKLKRQQQQISPEPLMQNSITKKNIKCKNPFTKNDLHREYESYRNRLSTIIK